MMDRLDPRQSLQGQSSPALARRPLRYDDRYRCPVCYYGELTGMTLMESFGCSFCRHIFTADLPTQVLRLADNTPALSWRWDGQRWRRRHGTDMDFGPTVVILGTALVVFPTLLVGLAVYLFPPLPDAPGAWFPPVWVGLTGISHLVMVLWLAGESYALPLYRALRVLLSRQFTLGDR